MCETKLCNKCNKIKNITEFPFKNKEKNKRSSICSECHNEYKREYYKQNKESHYQRNEVQNKKLRDYLTDIKNNSCCVVCGESDISCLDFHHITDDKRANIARLVRYGSLKKLEDEIDKCVVLCSNCHRKLHYYNLCVEEMKK